MKYLPLFSLDIVHDYYSDRKCADFQIVPTEGTLRLIGNFRCILKNNPGGIRILVPVTDGDTPFITHPIGLVFGFRLQLQNPDFPLFTDMSVIDKLESPIYINSGSEPNLKLADRARNAVIQKMHQAFAEVEITIRLPELFDLKTEKKFQLVFPARAARWKYFLIATNSNSIPTIADGEQGITFEGGPLDPKDEFAVRFADQYPNKQFFQFVSKSPVACSQSIRKSIQLRMDGIRVVDSLPNPSYQNYRIDVNNPTSEHSLYQIVKYMTR